MKFIGTFHSMTGTIYVALLVAHLVSLHSSAGTSSKASDSDDP